MGYIFMVSLCRVSFSAQPFVSFLLPNFLFFVFVVSFFQKKKSFGLGLSFDFCVFYLIVVRLKMVFKRTIYPVLIWFGYRGFFFLSHDINLWFFVFSKLRWLFQFTI